MTQLQGKICIEQILFNRACPVKSRREDFIILFNRAHPNLLFFQKEFGINKQSTNKNNSYYFDVKAAYLCQKWPTSLKILHLFLLIIDKGSFIRLWWIHYCI
jgi:hypothetical protein